MGRSQVLFNQVRGIGGRGRGRGGGRGRGRSRGGGGGEGRTSHREAATITSTHDSHNWEGGKEEGSVGRIGTGSNDAPNRRRGQAPPTGHHQSIDETSSSSSQIPSSTQHWNRRQHKEEDIVQRPIDGDYSRDRYYSNDKEDDDNAEVDDDEWDRLVLSSSLSISTPSSSTQLLIAADALPTSMDASQALGADNPLHLTDDNNAVLLLLTRAVEQLPLHEQWRMPQHFVESVLSVVDLEYLILTYSSSFGRMKAKDPASDPSKSRETEHAPAFVACDETSSVPPSSTTTTRAMAATKQRNDEYQGVDTSERTSGLNSAMESADADSKDPNHHDGDEDELDSWLDSVIG